MKKELNHLYKKLLSYNLVKEAEVIKKISAVLSRDMINKYKNYVPSKNPTESILGSNFSMKMEENASKTLKEMDQGFVNTLLQYAEAGDEMAKQYLSMIIEESQEQDIVLKIIYNTFSKRTM